MSITPEFAALIDRLNQELNQTEQQTTECLNLLRELISCFPDNAIILQYYAFLNAAQLFVENSKRQMQAAVELVSPTNVSDEEIHDSGEEIGTILGQTLEVKLRVERIISRLESEL